jgi:hypothetical protein
MYMQVIGDCQEDIQQLGSGFARALIENTPVLLTCPLLESMPLHLWKIAAQAFDVGLPVAPVTSTSFD